MISKLRLALATIITLSAILIPVDLFFRSSYAANVFLPPSYGVELPIFDSQFSLLEAFYQQEGQIDCLVLGSSIVRVSFKPEIFENAYYEQTGDRITCFNVGINSLSAEAAGNIAPVLVKRLKPKLLIYCLSPRAFIVPSERTGPAWSKSDWVKYISGEPNIHGFLIDELATYRYYLRYQAWTSPDLISSLSYVSDLQTAYNNEQGYEGNLEPGLNVNIAPSDTNTTRDNRFLRWMADYHPFAEDLEGLKQVANLSMATTTRIMFIEAPSHRSFMQYFGDPEQYYSNFISPVQQIADDFDVAFWRLRELYPVPGEFWNDRHHMNANGALVYSDWLGTQIGKAVNQGLLANSMPQELLYGPPDPKLKPNDIDFFFTNPYGLNDQNFQAFQRHNSPQLIPNNGIIWNPAENAENLRLVQYNIGADLSSVQNISQHERAFDLINWFEEIQAHSQIDSSHQLLLDRWRQSHDMQLLEEAGISYLLISDGWLLQQDEATRNLFANRDVLKPIRTLEHRTFAPIFTIYRIKT